MNTVARIASAFQNLVQENQLVALLLDAHLEVSGVFKAFYKAGKFVVVRRKQRDGGAGRFVVQSFHNRPRNREAVKGARSATDFVEEHQAVRSRIAQNVRGLNHLDHERRKAAAQAVACAHAGKDAVHHADAGTFGRHKAADLRHEHNKTRLAQVSRFTGHVRARNEHEAGRFGRKIHIVRDKVQVRIHRDNHRMETALDFDAGTFEDFGANVIVLACGAGKAVKRIHMGNRICDFLQFGTPAVHAFAKFAENLVFQRMNVDFGVTDDGFAFLHLGRNVAFSIHRRLLADVFVGNRARGLRHLRLGNFDVVTENAVVANLQARDAEAFTLADFQGGNPFAAFLDVFVHGIEFRVCTRANHAALAHGQRQVIVKLREEFFAAATGGNEGRSHRFKNRRIQALKYIGHLGCLRKRTAHARQVAGIRAARTHTAHQAFHIENRSQRFLEFV